MQYGCHIKSGVAHSLISTLIMKMSSLFKKFPPVLQHGHNMPLPRSRFTFISAVFWNSEENPAGISFLQELSFFRTNYHVEVFFYRYNLSICKSQSVSIFLIHNLHFLRLIDSFLLHIKSIITILKVTD